MIILTDEILKPEELLTHAVILGTTGSGKTVLGKNLIEEAVLSGIPVIAIDPQGDLVSMVSQSNTPAWNCVPKSIWTPGSSIGHMLTINPLVMPAPPRDEIEKELTARALSAIAESLATILGYNLKNAEGRSTIATLETMFSWCKFGETVALETLAQWATNLPDMSPEARKKQQREKFRVFRQQEQREAQVLARTRRLNGARNVLREPLTSFQEFAARFYQEKPHPIFAVTTAPRIAELGRRLKQLLTNSKIALYNSQGCIQIDEILRQSRLSFVYLNTLYSETERDSLVAQVALAIHRWMMQHPSPKLQLVLYLDEASAFLPAGMKMTASKKALLLLFKQARKYGVGCVVATQNPGDLDYKALSQFNTWFVGRTLTPQDVRKFQHLYNTLAGDQAMKALSEVRNLTVGNFHRLRPGQKEAFLKVKSRMPLTPHFAVDEGSLGSLVQSSKRAS